MISALISCFNIRIPCIRDFITLALFQTDGGWVRVRTLEYKQQETSKLRKRKSRFTQSCAISLFLPHFDVVCDLVWSFSNGNGGTATRERQN